MHDLEETLKQIFYRSLIDTSYGTKGFSKVPLTEDIYGEYLDLAKYITKHYQSHDSAISSEELKISISVDLKKRRKYTDDLYLNFVQDINDIVQVANGENFSNTKLIEQETTKWLYNQLTVKRIKRYILDNDNSQQGLESLAQDLDEISHVTNDDDLGETLSMFKPEDEDLRIEYAKETYGNSLSTGWDNLDEVTDGGLGYGEMGMLVAPSGTGKTTLLMNLATNYVLNGKHVLYFVLEERMARMENKMLSLLSNQNRHFYYKDKDDDGNKIEPKLDEEKFKQLNKYMEKAYEEKRVGDVRLWVKEPYQLTPKDIERVLNDTLRRDGAYPDVVIIDYPELLNNPFERKGINEYSAMGRLYHELRAVANRYKVVLWVVSQTNRTAYTQDIKTVQSIEGSKEKLNSVEFCGTLNQTSEEFSKGFMRIYVDKSRNRPESTEDPQRNSMLKFKVNTKTVRISCETPDESDNHDNLLSSIGNKGHKPEAFKKSEKELSELRNNIPDDLRV